MNASLYPLIASGVSAGAKAIKAGSQRKVARNLKESQFIPDELGMNKNLAELQAFSREAPGSAKAEENVRRAQANTLSAIKRGAGGDVSKLAAGSVASQQAANDANAQIATRGKDFAENAYNRLYGANNAIAGQKRQNRNELNQAKVALLAASDQNYMQGFNDLMNGAMASAYMSGGGGGGSGSGNRSVFDGGNSSYDPTLTDAYGRFTPSNIRNPWMK
jgi:hypothetical protein